MEERTAYMITDGLRAVRLCTGPWQGYALCYSWKEGVNLYTEETFSDLEEGKRACLRWYLHGLKA